MDYDLVLKRVHLTKQGASLLELKQSAEGFDLACEVRRVDVDGLRAFKTPVIAHFMGTPSRKDDARDHFAVILESSPRGYRMFDSLNAKVEVVDPGFVARNFSGYALIPTPRPARMGMFWPMFALSLLLLNIYIASTSLKSGSSCGGGG